MRVAATAILFALGLGLLVAAVGFILSASWPLDDGGKLAFAGFLITIAVFLVALASQDMSLRDVKQETSEFVGTVREPVWELDEELRTFTHGITLQILMLQRQTRVLEGMLKESYGEES